MEYKKCLEISACVSAASFHLGGGVVLAFSAILIPQLESEFSDIKVTKEDISWIASIIGLVVPLGALPAGYMADRVGRLNTIRLAAIPYIIGWVCLAMSQDLMGLIIGRFLTGLGMAIGMHPSFVYITEVSRPELRGALSCVAVSLTSLGMVVVYSKGAFLHWRLICWLSSTYCLLPLIVLSLWVPESPVWLVSRGRNEEALKSLNYFYSGETKAGLAEKQLAELIKDNNKKESLDQSRSVVGKLLQALTTASTLKPMLILTGIFIFQQFSGIYMTIFYTVSFFGRIGASVNVYASTVGIGVVRLIMGLITSLLLKNFGRRTLFLISSLTMAVFIFISGYLSKEISQGNMDANVGPVVCVLVYMIVGVAGLMSIPWTMTAELFPLEIRGMAHGLMVAVGNVIMFAALKVYPFLEDMLGSIYAVQWMFALSALGAAAFIFIFLPETHDKALAEIQEYFSNNTIYILRKKVNKTLECETSKVQEEEIPLEIK